ncbi:MAG: hypothetical protein RSC92_04855 [Clostridia bacterium]
MSDIVLSEKKKINIFDRIIQSVVILVNINKMNRAIDEHLNSINKLDNNDKKEYEQNILKEIVFVKYQYEIMQKDMYDLKINYSDEIIDNINSNDKITRLNLQKYFLEMEYDRVTKSRFKFKEDLKYSLITISTVIDKIKQDIKDEGKNNRYNALIKYAADIDTFVQTDEYEEKNYKEMFDLIDDYVSYINDNYDIAKLPSDERELIEYVIETMISGIQSDIDRHMYEFKILINICKNSYRYFKIIDKVFEKLLKIYDESLSNKVVEIKDYIKMYKEIYDMKIKTKVNDVHRTIKTEDEYLEYSKLVANLELDMLDEFILNKAYNSTVNDKTKIILKNKLGIKDIVEEKKEVKKIVKKQPKEKVKENVKEKKVVKRRIKSV